MEQKQTSSDQGGQRRRSNRRRRRRRRRSPATSSGPPPASGSAPPAHPPSPRCAPRRRHRLPRTASAPRPVAGPATDSRTCPLCGKPVLDLYTAIAYGESRAPAHFDCIVSMLGEREEVEEGARLCYLGGGSFGIVQMRAAARPGDRALLIHKRIEVEEKDAAPPWREELRLALPERRVTVAATEAVRSLRDREDDENRRPGSRPPPGSFRSGSAMQVIFPGTFDPPTNGHLDLMRRATQMFGRVVVVIAVHPQKAALFTAEERLAMVNALVADLPNTEVHVWNGLIVEFARRAGITTLLRGVRALSDFEYEFELSMMNKALYPAIETIFLPTDQKYFVLRSSGIKEVAGLGGDVSAMVPAVVAQALAAKLAPAAAPNGP